MGGLAPGLGPGCTTRLLVPESERRRCCTRVLVVSGLLDLVAWRFLTCASDILYRFWVCCGGGVGDSSGDISAWFVDVALLLLWVSLPKCLRLLLVSFIFQWCVHFAFGGAHCVTPWGRCIFIYVSWSCLLISGCVPRWRSGARGVRSSLVALVALLSWAVFLFQYISFILLIFVVLLALSWGVLVP